MREHLVWSRPRRFQPRGGYLLCNCSSNYTRSVGQSPALKALSELAYEDLENLPEATEDSINRLFERDVEERVGLFPETDSVLHPYFHHLALIELELWIRAAGNDPNPYHYILVYQYPGFDLSRPHGRYVAHDFDVIANSAYRGWRCVKNNVFIDIPETAKD